VIHYLSCNSDTFNFKYAANIRVSESNEASLLRTLDLHGMCVIFLMCAMYLQHTEDKLDIVVKSLAFQVCISVTYNINLSWETGYFD
jgi:hypothetical protein